MRSLQKNSVEVHALSWISSARRSSPDALGNIFFDSLFRVFFTCLILILVMDESYVHIETQVFSDLGSKDRSQLFIKSVCRRLSDDFEIEVVFPYHYIVASQRIEQASGLRLIFLGDVRKESHDGFLFRLLYITELKMILDILYDRNFAPEHFCSL